MPREAGKGAALTLDHVSISLADGTSLFRDLSIAVTNERVGVVGRNGSGKSTLLRHIRDRIQPTAGSIIRDDDAGSLEQRWDPLLSGMDALGVTEALGRLERIEGGSATEEDLIEADWLLPERMRTALVEVGLPDADLHRPASSFSGGERVRLGIARLLIARPRLLLLDEPTNDLDAEGRSLIAGLIDGWGGAALVASHDRDLLEGMDRIVELSATGCHVVGGGWSAFEAARAARRERAEAELERAADAVDAAGRDAQQRRERKARRDKAGRVYAAKDIEPRMYLHAQSQRAERTAARDQDVGERQLDDARTRFADARREVEVVVPLHIDLPSTGLQRDRWLLQMEDVTVSHATDRRLGPWSLSVRGPERIALVGPNGSGKSTLLQVAVGDLEPATGTVRRAEGRVALLDQHVAMLEDSLDVVDNLRAYHPEMSREEAHAVAARFAFRAGAALKPAAVLSGGERMRAALACLAAGNTPVQLLLLDEPTNHLDLEAVELLEEALTGFDGAILTASHDSAFLERIGVERIVALARDERDLSK